MLSRRGTMSVESKLTTHSHAGPHVAVLDEQDADRRSMSNTVHLWRSDMGATESYASGNTWCSLLGRDQGIGLQKALEGHACLRRYCTKAQVRLIRRLGFACRPRRRTKMNGFCHFSRMQRILSEYDGPWTVEHTLVTPSAIAQVSAGSSRRWHS